MASFLSRVFRNRSLSRGSSFRNSEPSLNESSKHSSSNSRAAKKFNSSASVSNLGSYEPDTKELERNKLHKAAWTGNLKKVQRLARPGQVNLRDSQSRTPIHLAVVKGHVNIVRFLISQGARLDIQDDEGRTPLLKAVLSGVQNPSINYDICKTLIEGHAGDFINQPDKKGKTALHYAIEHGHENLVYLFLSTGNCDLNLQDRDEMTPLHLSIKRNNPRMIQAILSTDHQPQVDPNIVNRYGQTPLHTAASMGYDDIVRCLLCSGLDQPCDTTITDSNDSTALDLAKKNHHEISAKLIEEYQQKFGKRALNRGLSLSIQEAPSLKATSSLSMTPRANREVEDDDDDDTSDDSSSMHSQRPVVRQTLKRPSDQWSDDNGSGAGQPTTKNISALINNNPLAATNVLSPSTHSSISTLINANPLQSNKKTKISQPPSFMAIGPVVERMDSDQTTSRSSLIVPRVVPSKTTTTTTKKPVVSPTKSWSDDTISQSVVPPADLTKKTTGDSDTWDSSSLAQSDDEETGKYKPKLTDVDLHNTQAFVPPDDSSSDNDSFATEIRRMDANKPSTTTTGPGYKVIGPNDVVSQTSQSSSWTSPVRETSTDKVLQTLINQNPLVNKKSNESAWDDSRPLSITEDRSSHKSEPKSSTSVIGKLLVTPLSEPKEEVEEETVKKSEEHSIAHLPLSYERHTVRPSISSTGSLFQDARVNDLKESIRKLEQNQEDVMKLKGQLKEVERKRNEFEDLCRQQERLAREFEQKFQQEKLEKQQVKRTNDDLHFQVEQLNEEVQTLRNDKDRLNRLCLELKEKRNQSDEQFRQLQMKLLQDANVPHRTDFPSTVEIPIRSNNEDVQKLVDEKNFYQQEYERIKQERDQIHQEKTQIKLKYDGLLEEIRMILLDRSKLEQQLTTELQERMEQRQRSKEELHKYQLQIAEVNQKLVDAQARLVLLQSQTAPAPVSAPRTPSLPNVAQSDENYLFDHGEQMRTETARVKTELDRLRGDFDRIVSTYEPKNSLEQYAQIHSHIDVFRQYYEQEFRQRQTLRSKLNTSLPLHSSPSSSSSSLLVWKERRTDSDETLRKTVPSIPRNASDLLTNTPFRTLRENDHL